MQHSISVSILSVCVCVCVCKCIEGYLPRNLSLRAPVLPVAIVVHDLNKGQHGGDDDKGEGDHQRHKVGMVANRVVLHALEKNVLASTRTTHATSKGRMSGV